MTAADQTQQARRRRGRKAGGKIVQGSDSGEAKAIDQGGDAATYKAHDTLLIQLSEENPTWFEYGKNFEGRNATANSTHASEQLASKYRSLADEIYRREVQLLGKGDNGDDKWVESTIRKGTLKDRIAAMSVLVSNDPVHKFHAIDGLLQMTGSSDAGGGQTNSRVAQLAAEALEDLFLNTLIPKDRKLKTLDQRPLHLFEAFAGGNNSNNKSKSKTKMTLSPRILLLWRFEEMVKEKYAVFIRQYLTHTLREGLEISKVATLRNAGTLLRSLPEGESEILSLMVNKLGDPGKKTASAAGHELRRVLKEHPNMQIVVAREVQQLAHRPHLSSRALYNCITFLNQLQLVRDDGKNKNKNKNNASNMHEVSLPASLIKTYFRLFEVAVNSTHPGDKDRPAGEVGMKSRLLSALLTGVNRAHPYLPEKDQPMDEHVDQLYKVAHTAPPAASTQALLLLFHLSVGSGAENDEANTLAGTGKAPRQERFYRALYSTLSSPALVAQGKHTTMFFNLLYKAMKYDKDPNRVIAFAKRIMATTLHCNAPALAATLFLLNEIASHQDTLRAYLQDIPGEHAAKVVLHPTKREPRAALVLHTTDQKEQNKHVDESEGRRASSWELSLVAHHFHPSVAKFGADIGSISYSGDPLQDFSLARFLDKFAYRNAKSVKRVVQHVKRGESVAERRSFPEGIIDSHLSAPVNDPSFLQRRNIDVQDEFFRKFFVERKKRDEIKGIKRSKDEEEDVDEDDAIDAVEEAVASDRNFEDFEKNWDSDSDEEDFVDQLALKMLEDSAGGEPVDPDDDPDMEDWGDMDGSEGEDDADTKPVGQKMSAKNDSDSNESDSSSDESDTPRPSKPSNIEAEDVDAFMDAESDGSGDEESFDDDGDLLFAGDDDSDTSSENKDLDSGSQSKESPFMDAAAYEDMAQNESKKRAKSDSGEKKKSPKKKRRS